MRHALIKGLIAGAGTKGIVDAAEGHPGGGEGGDRALYLDTVIILEASTASSSIVFP